MAGHSSNDDNDIDWNTDDDLDVDNFKLSPSSSPVHSMSTTSTRPDGPNPDHKGISNETFDRFIEMGFSEAMIAKAIEETDGATPEPETILETLFKYSTNTEASSSKSKRLDHLTGMGFSEDMVIKAIQEYGDENVDVLINALLSYAEAEKLRETEDDAVNIYNLSNNNNDDNLYTLSSDGEIEMNSSHGGNSKLKALITMDYSREEASLAIERCGDNASIEEVIEFISAAQMARQLEEFSAEPDEREPIINSKKRRAYNEQPTRGKKPMANDDEHIELPNPMIGFGVPDEAGVILHRPDPIPVDACGPPYFYYENVAKTPKGVWAKISSHLYEIMPEFVDSKYFCAAARKRGYIHNLPIHNRHQILPPPQYTIQEAFPFMKKWWPKWDKRTKLNCLVTSIASAPFINGIREKLEEHNGEPPLDVQKAIIKDCKRYNLVWVGKNKVATLEPDEMEKLLGFPKDHTRGGGISTTDRYKSLGNSFQVDTVAYHLSVLKPLFPNGIKVLSLFTGIGGGEVALYRLGIPMNVVVSVEISAVNQNILRCFWENTNQKGTLREYRDVQELDDKTIEQLMEEYGGFDLVIGGSPCNNLAGLNQFSRNGLEGDQSSLFFDYCRILDTVRRKAAQMRR